jgi:DNA helicase-2/ATP-dependent DNA helicase PcrA
MEMYGTPSRFLREIPPALVREVRPKVSVNRPASYGPPRAAALESASGPGLRLGQRVAHPSFGVGVVTDAEGSGTHARVQVNFERGGAKWLVLGYANLQPA